MNDFMNFNYAIPSNILSNFTGEFLDIFADKLLQVFWPEDKQLWLDTLTWITGTVGWHEAFSEACKDLNMTDVLEYYEGLNQYDSYIFEEYICRMLKRWRYRK